MDTIVRFADVSYHHGIDKTILDGVSFTVRADAKIALMGQNGAGKSTLFALLTGGLAPQSGEIHLQRDATIAIARQVMDPSDLTLTVEQYAHKYCPIDIYDLRRRLSGVLESVGLDVPRDRLISALSGGQQARLLIAGALVQEPDLLLLDEPTNNLDTIGISLVTALLMGYDKSCIVISHDAEFLNSFTHGVLYLDSHTHKIEQYAGDYNDVVAEIAARIERQNRQNAQMARQIQDAKDNANFFAQKGGKMRNVAKKMYEKIDVLESEKVDVRREDRTIREFVIPRQAQMPSHVLDIDSYTVSIDQSLITVPTRMKLGRGEHLHIVGPNGIGKSTFIESLATGTAAGARITPGVRVGYYRQDFTTLNFDETVHESLIHILEESGHPVNVQHYRSVAAGFLITPDMISTKIGQLSEGQKGLVAFAQLVLQQPGLLILDEPTNHINFRHIPRIAEAVSAYEGTLILVSHVTDFVSQIRIDRTLDLGSNA